MNDNGDITFSGFFNPGQTNSTTPNGSIQWAGLGLRDYRVDPKYDYAVIWLPDTQAVFNLSWMGVVWFSSGAGYNGEFSSNQGYPCGPNLICGSTSQQKCKASPRTDKRCDGWMYTDPSSLVTSDFLSGDLLQWDNDVSIGHSGSALYTTSLSSTGATVAFAVVANGNIGSKAYGPRFRQSMWNDVCSWIAASPSSFGQHSLCN
jgi:hypothetical protein